MFRFKKLKDFAFLKPHHIFATSTVSLLVPRSLDLPNTATTERAGRAMTTTPQRTTSQDLERQTIANINEFGWHAVDVDEEDGHPPWTYTIGLYDLWHHPELIIVGRSRATAHHVLDTLTMALDHSRRLDLTRPTEMIIPGERCFFVDVLRRHHHDYVAFAIWYYRKREFPLYQIVWPDTEGRYPWHERAPRSFKEWQPILGLVPAGAECDN